MQPNLHPALLEVRKEVFNQEKVNLEDEIETLEERIKDLRQRLKEIESQNP
jgi:predicted  nucleic acid-binding Zn-ribbon protein